MKQLTLTFILTLFSISTYSQDYMETLTQKTCDCLKSKEESEDEKLSKQQIGICIIQEAYNYQEELLSEHNLDMNNLDRDGEALGKLIGSKMIAKCPDILLELSSEEEEIDIYEVQGKVLKINEEGFVSLSVKCEDGKKMTFYWLTFVSSEMDIQNDFPELKNKTIKLEYELFELFDPKIKEYRNFNIISSIQLVEPTES